MRLLSEVGTRQTDAQEVPDRGRGPTEPPAPSAFQPRAICGLSRDDQREGGRSRAPNNEKHTRRKIITLASKVEPDLLTSQLHKHEKVITEETFPRTVLNNKEPGIYSTFKICKLNARYRHKGN